MTYLALQGMRHRVDVKLEGDSKSEKVVATTGQWPDEGVLG